MRFIPILHTYLLIHRYVLVTVNNYMRRRCCGRTLLEVHVCLAFGSRHWVTDKSRDSPALFTFSVFC